MTGDGPRDHGEQPDIILVDAAWNNVDFLAGQLAKRGVRVHAFTPRLRRPRYLRGLAYPYQSYVKQPLTDDGRKAFLRMVDRIRPACVIPCTEQALYWLWELPEDIQRLCLPNVSPSFRPLLLDRALLLERAAACGVPVPEAIPLDSRADCDAAIAGGLPLVVKSGQSIGSDGVALCRTGEEVIAAYERFAPRGHSVAAQRFYVGPTYLAGALFVQGEPVHFYAGEKTEMWPKLTGYAYEITSAGEPYLSQLRQYAEWVCKELEWTGLASFDFVLGEDGKFRLVDFNPRLWGSACATGPSGVDLYGGLARLIRDGAAGPPSKPRPGVVNRVFPKYTFEPSGMGLRKRIAGLRDAPWNEPVFVVSETLAELRLRAGERVRARLGR